MIVTDGGVRPDGTFVSWPARDTAALTEAFRRAVLRLFVRRGLFEPEDAEAMLAWVLAAATATAAYAWGDRSLAFHHCTTCGCTTHWAGIDPSGAIHPAGIDPKSGRMGVNARLLAPADRAAAKVRKFDGADTWRYLDD